MGFGHEKLDVYGAAIEYVGWAYRFCEILKGDRNAKDQLPRASQAIPLNIAEGNGKEPTVISAALLRNCAWLRVGVRCGMTRRSALWGPIPIPIPPPIYFDCGYADPLQSA